MHPVIDIIKRRKKQGSLPGQRSDPHKVGLAIEGGGLRGAVSAGMASALESLGLRDSFDAVYGTSAGAFNGAYFLAGQIAYGTTIYYEDINKPEFASFTRLPSVFFRRLKPIMSLDYLETELMSKRKYLDTSAILESPIPLHIVASSVSRAKAIRLSKFSSREQLLGALKATACVPLISGPPIQLDGDEYFDGGLFESIPFDSAIKDGCSHVLVLATRPRMKLRGTLSFLEKTFGVPYLNSINPELGSQLERRPSQYRACLTELEKYTITAGGPSFTYVIQPSEHAKPVSRFSKKRDAVLGGARAGMRALIECFDGGKPEVHEVLRPFAPQGRDLTLNGQSGGSSA